jgi:hypothetical protein
MSERRVDFAGGDAYAYVDSDGDDVTVSRPDQNGTVALVKTTEDGVLVPAEYAPRLAQAILDAADAPFYVRLKEAGQV